MSDDLPVEPRACTSEQDYFELWNKHLDPTTAPNHKNNSRLATQLAPTELAETGGRLADRAAWVFIAGYQGALRQCFPVLRDHPGWASYVVSEARGESGQPTCQLITNASGSYLQGTKNWVAASAHLRWLVVNATNSADSAASTTSNLLIAADVPGAVLIQKPGGRFLPELVVGRAEFSEVPLAEYSRLDKGRTFVDLFGLIEARCLLVAMAGHFAQLAPNDPQPAQSLMLSAGLATAELGSQASIDVLLDAMALLVEWFEGWHGQGRPGDSAAVSEMRKRWSQDQRLLQMHRPLLLKRQALH